MNSHSPARRPLAPTSINAILASPLPSPAKSSANNLNTSLRLPPISLNRPLNGSSQTHENSPQYRTLPHLNEAISPTLRHPLPAGLRSGTCPQPPFPNPTPAAAPVRPPPAHSIPTATLAQPSKRKAEHISTYAEDLADEDVDSLHITENCDQIRQKIYSLLNSGDMKMNEFIRELKCNTNAYSRFMGQNGPDKGYKSDVYVKAWRFFKAREMKGIQTPVKRVKKELEERKNDVSSIKLDGEDTISVQVYDSCDEIRKKIRAHLIDPTVTQAGFLREIAKTYPDGRKIQSKVLNDFLGKRGKFVGNTTAVYYSSYVFFEKMRIRDGREKTKHRNEMEKEWVEEGGIDTKHRDNGKAYYFKGS